MTSRKISLRSALYRSARLMGDVEAAEKGPEAFANRETRRVVYRQSNRLTGTLLRALGLQGGRRR